MLLICSKSETKSLSEQLRMPDALSSFRTGYCRCFRKHLLLHCRREVKSNGEESSTPGSFSALVEDCSFVGSLLVQCQHLRLWSYHHGTSFLPSQHFANGIAEFCFYADLALADSRCLVLCCLFLVARFSVRPPASDRLPATPICFSQSVTPSFVSLLPSAPPSLPSGMPWPSTFSRFVSALLTAL